MFDQFRKNSIIKKHITPLCYHAVADPGTFEGNLHEITPVHFEMQLKQLMKLGITFLPVDEYLIEKAKGKKKIAAITFDDGYKSVTTHAAPILSSLNLPFTIFLTTRVLEGKVFWRDMVRMIIDNNWIDEFMTDLQVSRPNLSKSINPQRFYWSTKSNEVNSKQLEIHLSHFLESKQIKLTQPDLYFTEADLLALPQQLFTLGNHTQNHFRMSTLSKSEQNEEINNAQNIIDRINCNKSKVFAIPFGENGSFNQDSLDLLHELNYTGYLMTNQDQFGQKKPKISLNTHTLRYSNRILPINENSIL